MQLNTRFNKNQIFSLIPCVLVAISIFYLSHLEKVPQIYVLSNLEDKIQHFIAYFVLASFLQFHLHSYKLKIKNITIYSICISALYGASDELHQSFVIGRYADFYDWIADFIGAVASISIYYLINKFYKIIFMKN